MKYEIFWIWFSTELFQLVEFYWIQQSLPGSKGCIYIDITKSGMNQRESKLHFQLKMFPCLQRRAGGGPDQDRHTDEGRAEDQLRLWADRAESKQWQSIQSPHRTQRSGTFQLARQEARLQAGEGQHPMAGGGEGQGAHRDTAGSVLAGGPALSSLPPPVTPDGGAINLESGKTYLRLESRQNTKLSRRPHQENNKRISGKNNSLFIS